MSKRATMTNGERNNERNSATVRKKVLFIICELYWGGAQKSLLKLIAEVSKKHDCVLAVYMIDSSFNQPVAAPVIIIDKEANINTERFSALEKIKRLYKRVAFIKKLKKEKKFDVCISFMEGADILNVLSKTKNCKTVTSIRGSIISEIRKPTLHTKLYLKLILPFIYKRSDAVVPVSIVLKDEMVEHFGVKPQMVTPVQNFYNAELYKELKAEPLDENLKELFSDNKTVISVGRLNVQKNFINLVRIFSIFKTLASQPHRLVIIGDGEEHDTLMEECEKNNLSVCSFKKDGKPVPGKDVYFVGYAPNPHKYVAKASCFLLPSLWEGFPNTLAEALLVGTPSIAADCKTGPFEIIEPAAEKNEYQLPAILLPIPNTAAINAQWASMLKRITEEPALQTALAQNAVTRMNDFSRENIVNKWFKIIEA